MLTEPEREHMFILALGHPPEPRYKEPEGITPRLQRVLDAMPADAVIEYRHLARLAGIQSSYCRAFPRLVANLGDGYAAKAVSAQSANPLPRWEGAGLFDLY